MTEILCATWNAFASLHSQPLLIERQVSVATDASLVGTLTADYAYAMRTVVVPTGATRAWVELGPSTSQLVRSVTCIQWLAHTDGRETALSAVYRVFKRAKSKLMNPIAPDPCRNFPPITNLDKSYWQLNGLELNESLPASIAMLNEFARDYSLVVEDSTAAFARIIKHLDKRLCGGIGRLVTVRMAMSSLAVFRPEMISTPEIAADLSRIMMVDLWACDPKRLDMVLLAVRRVRLHLTAFMDQQRPATPPDILHRKRRLADAVADGAL